MATRKTQNSIIALATLAACLFVFVIAATQSALAQGKEFDPVINKRPFQDLGKSLRIRLDQNGLDLAKPFKAQMKGTIGKNGKLEIDSLKTVVSEGDQTLVGIAFLFTNAVSESGYFQYLSYLDVKEVDIVLIQDSAEFTSKLSVLLKTRERANAIAAAIDTLLSVLRARKDGYVKSDRDTLLLNATKVATTDKSVSISLKIPKATLTEFVMRELQNMERC